MKSQFFLTNKSERKEFENFLKNNGNIIEKHEYKKGIFYDMEVPTMNKYFAIVKKVNNLNQQQKEYSNVVAVVIAFVVIIIVYLISEYFVL